MKTSGAASLLRQLLPALLGFLLATPLSAAPPAATRPNDIPQYQALPLERSHQNHLLLRAHINGKPALLGVDTGASVSAIALDRRKHFGLAPLPGGSDLPPQLRINGGFNGLAIAHHLRLGALILVDEPMVAIDLNGPAPAAREFPEQQLDGLIGTDILFPTAAVLDCTQQVLYMKVDPDARDPIPGIDHRGWTGVPLHLTATWNLFVHNNFSGARGQLLIDTGAFMTLLDQGLVRRLRLPLHETPYSSAMVNLDVHDVQSAIIKRFTLGGLDLGVTTLGGFKVKSKEVGVIDLSDFIAGDLLQESPPVVGLLGMEFLRRHHGIIDFGAHRLYLKH
ncbi:MAG TPA: aspartyl protease family protein [Chthoniobacterales bacterium]